MALRESEAYDDEAYDDEAFDDEAFDDESEFISQLLGGPAAAIGNAIGGLFGGRPQPPRPPLPQMTIGVPGSGVSSATLNTPQGNATLRLPEPVVTRQEFEAGIRRLQEGINRDASRVNAVSRDLETLRTRVGAVVTDTQRDITRLRTSATQARRAQRAAIERLRREQSQQQMTSMVMTMMMQRQSRQAVEDHTHPPSTAAAQLADGGDNSAMMLLPMMMMGSGGSGDSSSMMMPMMMLAMAR